MCAIFIRTDDRRGKNIIFRIQIIKLNLNFGFWLLLLAEAYGIILPTPDLGCEKLQKGDNISPKIG